MFLLSKTAVQWCVSFCIMGFESLQPEIIKIAKQIFICFAILVRWKGLEPPTYWFVASHSIQLSYRHICLTTLFIIAHLFAFVKGFFKKILKKSKKVALCSRQLFLFGS